LFDRYFKESSVTYRMMRDYKPSSLFIPQLSAIATSQLTAIQEEDEEEAEREAAALAKANAKQMEEDDPFESCHSVASNIYYGGKQQKEASAHLYDMQDMADSMCIMAVVPDGEVGGHEFLSYADILAGRRDSKRKLSENSMSSDGELDYETRMM
jgi:hypothetical protein